jgi:hypothetical protein
MVFEKFKRGMGIGGWLTNYKRFNVLPENQRLVITVGDREHFESYITERDVAYIASLGLDHVRVGFDQIVLEEEPYVYNEKIFALLDDFVSWCEKYSLGIVFNLHKAVGNYCDIQESVTLFESEELQNRFIALWAKIEERYSDKRDIAFELLNEVRDIDPALWNNLADKTVAAIRKINPERLIILGCVCWGAPTTLPSLKLFDDDAVIYTFHCYEPFEFTHQMGVLQAAPLYYNRKMEYPSDDVERYRDYYRLLGWESPYDGYERIDKNYIRDYLSPAIEFRKKHPDKLLWCGEFGTIRHIPIKFRENWMRDVISILLENGIPYSVWNYLSTPNDGNRFSLVDDETREILSEEMARIIGGEI